MKNHCKIMLVAVIMAFLSLFTQAFGESRHFEHITTSEGLPHQQVESLDFDNIGNLWIGTRNGLARYDGYTIRIYQNDSEDSRSLGHNFINKLFCDSKGRLWVACYQGINRYDKISDNFVRYDISNAISGIVEMADGRIVCVGDKIYIYEEDEDSFSTMNAASNDFILSAASTSDGRLFIITNHSIYYYKDDFSRVTHLPPSIYSSFLTGADGVAPMIADSSGRLWVGCNGHGVMCIDIVTLETTIFDEGELGSTPVRTICEDKDRRIWLGTENGIFIIDNSGIEHIVQNFYNSTGLNDNAVYTIACDDNNNIWAGTYFGGINAILRHGSRFKTIRPGYDDDHLSGKAVRQIIEPIPGKLWIATEDGGLNILDLATGKIRTMTSIPGLGTNVHSLFHDTRDNAVWIGTFLNGLFKYDLSTGRYQSYMPGRDSGFKSCAIFDFAMLCDSTLWVGTTIGLYRYDRENDKFELSGIAPLDDEFIYGLKADPKRDRLWVATRNRGVYMIDNKTGETENWSTRSKNSGLLDDYIPSLLIDQNGVTWVGTNNFGVWRIDPISGEIKRIVFDAQLSTSCICGMFEDPDNNIWIATSHGLVFYDHKSGKFARYTVYNGLPTSQFNFHSACLASDGYLYMGTVNGMIKFAPTALSSDTNTFEVHLKDLYINDVVVPVDSNSRVLPSALDYLEELTLDYRQAESFGIEFGIINPGNVGNIRYQVMLEGHDKAWHDIGDMHRYSGMHLSAGNYKLHIRANGSDYNWDNAPIKTIGIRVLRAPYASWYAIMIYILCLLALLYLLYRQITKRHNRIQEKKIAQMKSEQASKLNQAKIDFFTEVSHELKTPLSLILAPLKQLNDEIVSNDGKKHLETAIRNADKLTDIINRMVTFNKVESGNFQFFIERGNPMEFIAKICSLFVDTSVAKQINLSVDCEDNGEEVWFSSFYTESIVANLISNALKFTESGGSVKVVARIIVEDDKHFIECMVADTGIGIVKEELENIFKRFYQTKRGYSVSHRGWGIGLSLVKKLTEIHGGTIEVYSEKGVGTTFTVKLRADSDAFPRECIIDKEANISLVKDYSFTRPLIETATVVDPEQMKNASRLRILIVEDEDELRRFLTSMFRYNYIVETACDGQEALDKLADTHVDLIISDVMMPRLDGISLCKNIKRDIATSHIPVILLTAKSGSNDVIEGYRCGAEAYVAKPFDPTALLLQVNNIMSRSQHRIEKLVTAEADAPIEDDTLNDLDRSFIERLNRLIDENLDNSRLDVAYLTEALGMSRTLLYSKMKTLLGVSIADYIKKKRMVVACKMLVDGHNVSETTYSVGFTSPGYFSKVFRKEYGISPTEYAQSHNHRNNSN